jgi:hypothetical protein
VHCHRHMRLYDAFSVCLEILEMKLSAIGIAEIFSAECKE